MHHGQPAELHAGRRSPRRAAAGSVWWCSAPRPRSGSCSCSSTRWSQQLAAAAPREQPPAAVLAGEFRARARRQPQSALRTVTTCLSSTSRRARSPARSSTTGRAGPGRRRTCSTSTAGCRRAGGAGWCRSRPRPTARCSSISCRSSSATISGFTTKFQLYTVPGQIYYNATRKLVLQGADGVVFVADSQARRFDDNLESLQNLQDNLLAQGVDVRQLPVVFQYNKQDLPRDLILTARGAGRRAQLPRRSPSFRGRRAARDAACSRRCAASRSWCCKRLAAGSAGRRDRHAESAVPLRQLRRRRGQPAGRRPRRRRWPSRRARSTTRCSSTPARASARRTC